MAAGEELGVGYVTLTVSTRGLGKDLAKQFLGAEKQATKSGKRMGKNVNEAFEDELDLDALAREIEIAEAKGTRAIEKASEAQRKAREKSQDAAAKQALEERRLAAARLKAENAAKAVTDTERRYQRAVESSGESSREAETAAKNLASVREREANASVGVASAEDKVTRARRGAVDSSEAMARATRDVTDAQDELQKELKRTRDAYAEAEAAAKRAGEEASDKYVDGWRGMATRMGRVVRDNVNKALGSVGVAGKGFVQGVTYAESFKKGMATVKQSSPVHALGFLSGGRVMADMGSHFTKMTTNLDRAIPVLALAGTGIASLAGAALSASAGLLGVVSGLGSIAAVGLLLPGMFAAAGAGIAVLAMALMDTGEVLKDLGPQFEALQKTVSGNFWAEAAQPIRDFVYAVLPILNEGLGAAATEMGRWAVAITGVLGSAEGLSFISQAIGYMVHAADIAGDGIAAMTGALLQLSTVGMSYLPDLASWFNNISYTFEAWVAKSAASGDLFKWIDAGLANLKALGGVLVHTVGIFHALGQAAYDAGAGGLIGLASGMKDLDEAMHGPIFQGALVTLFKGADVAMQGLAVGVRGLGDAFVAMAPTLAHVMGVAGLAIGLLVEGLAKAVSHPVFQQGLRDFFDGVLIGVQALAPVLPIVGEKFGHMATLAGALARNLGVVLAVAIENLAPILNHLFEVITPLVPKLGEIISALIEGVAPVVSVVVGFLGTLIGVVVNVVSWLAQFDGVLQVVGGALAGIAIAIGAFVAIAKVVTIVTNIWKAAMVGLNIVMGLNPFGLIVLAVAALVAAFIAAYNNIGWFKDGVNAVWEGIKIAAGAVVTWFQTVLVPWFQAALAAVGAVFSWLYINIIQPVWNGIKNAVSAFVNWFMTSALPFIQSVIQGIGNVMTWLWVNIIQPIWNGILVFITMIVAATITVLQGIVWFVRTYLGPAFTWLYNAIILPVWNAIKAAIGAAWAFIRDVIFTPLMNFVRGPLTSAWLWIRDTVSQVWNNIKMAISSAWAWVRDVVLYPLINFVRGALTAAWNWLRNLVSQVWTAIRNTISSIWNFIRDRIFNPMRNFINGPLAGTFRWLRDSVIIPVWNGIKGAISGTWNWVRDHVLNPMIGFVKNNVVGAWNTAKDGIDKAWTAIKGIVSKPVDFVINTVINDGFIKNFNKIADKVKIDKLPEVKFNGFARGGVLPGRSSWRNGDDQLVPMRSGEGVYMSEVMSDPYERDRLHRMNDMVRRGMDPAKAREYLEDRHGVPGPDAQAAVGASVYNGVGGPSFSNSLQHAIARTGVLKVSGLAPSWDIGRAMGMWDGAAGVQVKSGGIGANHVSVKAGPMSEWWAGYYENNSIRLNSNAISGKDGRRTVAAHELGHALGLPHSMGWGRPSIMDYGSMYKVNAPTSADIKELQKIYPGGTGVPGEGSSGFFSGMFEEFTKLVDLSKLLSGVPGAGFVPDLLKGAATMMWDGVKKFASSVFHDDSEEGGGEGAGRWAGTVREALGRVGLPTTAPYVDAWLRQIQTESGGNPRAVQGNIGDINNVTGDIAKGLVQVIGSTFQSYRDPELPNDRFNPLASLTAGMRWAKAKYGVEGMLGAIGHGRGYARGGIVGESTRSIGRSVSGVWDDPVGTVHALRPGVSTIYNGTGSTEAFQRVDATAPGAGQEAHLHLHGAEYDESRMLRRGAEEWSRAFRKAGVAA